MIGYTQPQFLHVFVDIGCYRDKVRHAVHKLVKAYADFMECITISDVVLTSALAALP